MDLVCCPPVSGEGKVIWPHPSADVREGPRTHGLRLCNCFAELRIESFWHSNHQCLAPSCPYKSANRRKGGHQCPCRGSHSSSLPLSETDGRKGCRCLSRSFLVHQSYLSMTWCPPSLRNISFIFPQADHNQTWWTTKSQRSFKEIIALCFERNPLPSSVFVVKIISYLWAWETLVNLHWRSCHHTGTCSEKMHAL